MNRLVDVELQQTVVQQTLNNVQQMVIQDKLEKWLDSPPNPTTKQHETQNHRKGSTGSWFLDSNQFINWQDCGGSLWIEGPSGSGKSVLWCASTCLRKHQILSRELGSPAAVAFFYFDFRNRSTQKVEIALRRIILQLSSQSPNVYGILEKQYSFSSQILPTYVGLLQVLQDLLLEIGRTYIVFDALDECHDSEHEQLVGLIALLNGWKHTPLHLLVTSQPRVSFARSFPDFIHTDLRTRVVWDDIRLYVTGELQTNSKLKPWAAESEKIIDQVVIKSNGMFRLAACLLVELSRHRLGNLDRTLQNLPEELFDVYDRFMDAIPESEERFYAIGVLRWLIYRKNPPPILGLDMPKIEQYADAVSFKVSSTSADSIYIYDPNLRDKITTLIPQWLEGMVTINNKKCLELAHSSVRQYLLSERFSQKFNTDLNLAPSHTSLTKMCAGYLLHFVDHLISQDTLAQYPTARYAAYYLDLHLEESSFDIPGLWPSLLHLFDQRSQRYRAFIQLYHIYDDMELYQDYRLPGLLYTFCDKPQPSLKMIKVLLESKFDVNEQDDQYAAPLQAVCRRSKEGVQLLLDYGANINALGGYYGSALQAACSVERNNNEVVKLLLDNGANVNALGGYFGCALQAACSRSNDSDTQIIQLLLDHGADINVLGGYHGSALQAACNNSNIQVVQLLLDYGANINTQGGIFGSALHGAVFGGKLDIAQLLLQHGADVNAPGGLSGQMHDMFHKLLPNLSPHYYLDISEKPVDWSGSVLEAAHRNGHMEMVELVLKHGAVDTRPSLEFRI
ncbi:hypothetical protein B0H15DRAFT_917036 [Mycena belliarum]|uniref:Nephrocystin 3-like N-terminal domain-containing protein n=1 Tax=Mycena belliarum TaxID=1033014 RepID=A0AAD6XJ55_9AGAR|nr:hypothetical protein B0H15DRAFT_917036 [Mycena belliae]